MHVYIINYKIIIIININIKSLINVINIKCFVINNKQLFAYLLK